MKAFTGSPMKAFVIRRSDNPDPDRRIPGLKSDTAAG